MTTNAQPTPRTPPFELDAEQAAAQIGRGFAAVLRQQGGSMTMRLEPGSLGALKIRMDLDAGRVEATLEASSDRARRLLDHALPALRAALESHGLSVDRLDVRLTDLSLGDGRPGTCGPGWDGGAGEQDQLGGRAAGSEHPPGVAASPERERLAGEIVVVAAEPMRAPNGLGVGAGGALVRLRLDTVA